MAIFPDLSKSSLRECSCPCLLISDGYGEGVRTVVWDVKLTVVIPRLNVTVTVVCDDAVKLEQ